MRCMPVWVLLLALVLGLLSPGWRQLNVNGDITQCQLPATFEGSLSGTTTNKYAYGLSRKAFWKGTVHVDTVRNRLATYAKFEDRGQLTRRNAFITKTAKYLMLPESKQCMMDPMEVPFIPDDVMDITEGQLGGVPVQIWESPELEAWEEGTHLKVYVARDTCMPMSFDVDVKTIGVDKIHSFTESFSATLTDMKEGVKDMRVFDLPEYCPKERSYLELGDGFDDEANVLDEHEVYEDRSHSSRHEERGEKNYTTHIYQQQQAFVWQ